MLKVDTKMILVTLGELTFVRGRGNLIWQNRGCRLSGQSSKNISFTASEKFGDLDSVISIKSIH